jgi:peptide/nickel transport system substrate-binding protein
VPPPRGGEPASDSFAHEHANGTGPFRLVEGRIPDRFVLERNPDWWGLATVPVEAERLEWRRYNGDEARVRGFTDGEIDLIWRPPLHRLDELRRLPGVRWVGSPSNRVWLLQFDEGSPELKGSDIKGRNPFADRRVRQAMYQGIDIERLVRVWFGGYGVPRGMLIPPGVGGWSEELDRRPPHDPEGAKALLVEAGYPDGFSIRMSTGDPPWPIDHSIQDGLAPIGIRAEFEGMSDLEWMERVQAGTIGISVMESISWSFDSGEIL